MTTEGRLRVPKAADLIAGRLRRQIIHGALEEGDPLPSEQDLVSRYGVSRPTAREALRLLEAEGLARMQRGRGGGARVCVPTGQSAALHLGVMLQYLRVPVADLVEAMDGLEADAARRLAHCRQPDDVAALRANLTAGDELLHDEVALMRVATDFHREMVHRIGNQTTFVVHGILNHIVWETVLQGSDPDPARWGPLVPSEGHRQHERVVALIEAGNADAADQLWRAHLADCWSFLITADATIVDVLSTIRDE